MPRVMCVWFPRWPIQRLRTARPELKRSEPVLFAGQNQRPAIIACTAKAERLGVRIGQPLAEAKALLPKAVFLPADRGMDRTALCQLAIEFQRFTPLVGLEETSESECLLCEVAGCTHLWDGEEGFVGAVRSYWRDQGYFVQLALAGTVGAAWALAHTTALSLVPEGREEEAISGLPVAALRLPTATLEQLAILGLYTIGEVVKLPRDTLVSRFGVILPRRLDQALGLLHETFICERLKEPLAAFREWEVPIDDRFAVNHVCRQLLRELLSMAGRVGMGLFELEGEIRTEADSITIEIRLVEPTGDEQHLAQLVELQLERLTWSGGVIAVRWSAPRLGRLEQAQGRFFADDLASKPTRGFNTLVERLSSRLEAKAVLRVELVADAQPEHAVRLVPWTSALQPNTENLSLSPALSRGRPLRLLSTPIWIDVTSMVADGPPVRMVWNRQECPVVRSWGPERIATGWWRARDIERDYYRVEWADGTQAWVYRDDRSHRWFLHGFFD
jgi:protein ImuB